ncbi:MAG: ferritin-like domain-containing protein [Nanopusillaceae archaeon]
MIKVNQMHKKEVVMTEISHLLKTALADEWLAHTEYNILKVIARGKQRKSLLSTFDELIKDEWDHIGLISTRLQELDSSIIVDPRYWFKYSNAYIVPKEIETNYIATITAQLEDMAISRYNSILKACENDTVTRVMVEEILSDETRHRFLIKSFLEDLNLSSE